MFDFSVNTKLEVLLQYRQILFYSIRVKLIKFGNFCPVLLQNGPSVYFSSKILSDGKFLYFGRIFPVVSDNLFSSLFSSFLLYD